MTRFVLDASVTLSWLFPDEATTFTESILDSLKASEAVVPVIWPLEVGNVLTSAERRSRITGRDVGFCIAKLRRLPIRVDAGGAERGLDEVVTLARDLGLTTYDACYLELSIRESIPLATLDQELRRVAVIVGVRLVE